MSVYTTTIQWQRGDQPFLDQRYSRAHLWKFDGGSEVRASSSPHVVKLPYSDEHAVDPEEAFVAALSSCHMLFFLSIAAQAGFRVDEYTDSAEGVLEKDTGQRLSMTRVTLRPRVLFSGSPQPSQAEIQQMHHQAHDACFIANSVKTEVRCEPVFAG